MRRRERCYASSCLFFGGAADFNAEQMCENWMGAITEDAGGVASTPKRRSPAALYKKTMQMANSGAAY